MMLSFAFCCQFTLELLAGDLASDQASQRHHGSVFACGIIPVRFRSGRGCNLDIDPVPLDRHRLQYPMPGKGLGQWKRGMSAQGRSRAPLCGEWDAVA